MTQNTTTTIRPKRVKYFDANRKCARTRVFSSLEIAHAKEVFERIEDILLENNTLS
jgi:hypothetical protein